MIKSEILVVGSTQFVGSNMCNYLLQHTGLSVAGTDDLSCGFLGNLQSSLSSKSRFGFYPLNFADSVLSNKVMLLLSPKYIIVDLTNRCLIADVVNLIDSGATCCASKCILILPPLNNIGNGFAENYSLLLSLLENKKYRSKNMDIIALTPCELYGPRQDITGKFASMVIAALSGTAASATTSPGTSQWLYIKDLFHNVSKLMEPNGLPPGAYSLKSRMSCQDSDILSFMQSLMGKNRLPLKVIANEALTTPGVIDAINHFDLESSIEHTLCWYADNKWAWR